MTILGIGLDATDIPRLATLLERYGDRFLQRVFTQGEIAYVPAGGIQHRTWRAGSPRRKPP
jgi:phosphopantetheinyl transferase (holo-ACP synthase)